MAAQQHRQQQVEGTSSPRSNKWVVVAALQLATVASAAAGATATSSGGGGVWSQRRGATTGFVTPSMPAASAGAAAEFWGVRGTQGQGGLTGVRGMRWGRAKAWGIQHQTALRASTLPPPAAAAASSASSAASASRGGAGGAKGGKAPTLEDFVAQLEPFGVTGVRFCEDGAEDELAVCCPETRRLMDCTVDLYATVNGTAYCVALPIFNPVAICYHKGERMIPVENDCELMDRLYDFLAPTLEQEDLFLIRSPVCLTLDGDLGDLGEEGEFAEEELEGWEAFEREDDPWEDGEDPFTETKEGEEKEKEGEEEESSEFKDPVAQEYERMMNPKYWDDADAGDVQDAYGEDWEKVAAFEYDGVAYTMVKILEPVLVLAKEDPEFKGITKWILPSEDEAEDVGGIMEALIKVKLGIEDLEDEDEEEDEDEDDDEGH